jgi:hypothetical protein
VFFINITLSITNSNKDESLILSSKSIAKVLLAGTVLSVSIGLSGCGAMHTAIKKRNLDVQTKMSETIFLEPSEPERRIVYLDIRNTSDKDIDVRDQVAKAVESRGYRITNNPKEANYMLQANVLKVGKSDLRDVDGYMDAAFEGGAGGALTGAAISGATGGGYGQGGLIGAAVGMTAGFVGDALVDDVVFVMVTDLQIRERPLEGEVVTQTSKASLAQGSSTHVSQGTSGAKVNWKSYRTRIVSTANKVNLEFEEAQPVLQQALGKSISGIF